MMRSLTFTWSTMSNISSIFIWSIACEAIVSGKYILAMSMIFIDMRALRYPSSTHASHATIACYRLMAPVFRIPIN